MKLSMCLVFALKNLSAFLPQETTEKFQLHKCRFGKHFPLVNSIIAPLCQWRRIFASQVVSKDDRLLCSFMFICLSAWPPSAKMWFLAPHPIWKVSFFETFTSFPILDISHHFEYFSDAVPNYKKNKYPHKKAMPLNTPENCIFHIQLWLQQGVTSDTMLPFILAFFLCVIQVYTLKGTQEDRKARIPVHVSLLIFRPII